MATKKKPSQDEWGNDINLPEVPTPQQVTPNAPEYPMGTPMDMNKFYDMWAQMEQSKYPSYIRTQLGMQPEVTQGAINAQNAWQQNQLGFDIQRQQALLPIDLQRQQQMMSGAFNEQLSESQRANANQWQQANQYGQGYVDLFNSYAQGSNPEFMKTYGLMAGNVQQGLESGYQLGDALGREVTQGMRAQQAATGNYMGPAITAQEAYGTGSAAQELYNQRMAQGQAFLQGKQPTDLWGTMGLVMPGMQNATVQQGYYPNSAGTAGASLTQAPTTNFVSNMGLTGMQGAANMFSSFTGQSLDAQANYNNALIGATNANNTGLFSAYDKSFDQFLYNESVAHGLYDTPAAPNTSASQTGAIVQGVTGAVGAVGSAAAASAAASAFCWLARRCIPDRWLEWRKFIFTKAPAWFRKRYIYGAKSFAYSISMEEEKEIACLMIQCLSKK